MEQEIRAEKNHRPKPLGSLERPQRTSSQTPTNSKRRGGPWNHDEISWLRNPIPSGTVRIRHSPSRQAHPNKPSSDTPRTSGTGPHNQQHSKDIPRLIPEKQTIQGQVTSKEKSSSCPQRSKRLTHIDKSSFCLKRNNQGRAFAN